MLLHLQKYNLKIVYELGRELFIADTLSRAFIPNEPNRRGEDMQEQEEYLIRAIQQIGMVELLPMTTNVLQIFERKLSAAILSKS